MAQQAPIATPGRHTTITFKAVRIVDADHKRVSRLAANIPLIQRNLCPLSFVDVSQQTYISAMVGVYELNRVELLRDVFVWAYKRSCAPHLRASS